MLMGIGSIIGQISSGPIIWDGFSLCGLLLIFMLILLLFEVDLTYLGFCWLTCLTYLSLEGFWW